MKKKAIIIIILTSLLVILTSLFVVIRYSSKSDSAIERLVNDKRTNVVCNSYISRFEKSYAFFGEDGKLVEAAVIESFYTLLNEEEIKKNFDTNYNNLEDLLKEYIKYEFEYDKEIKKVTTITRYDLVNMPIQYYSIINLDKLLKYNLDFEKTVKSYMKSNQSHVCVGSYFEE